MKRAVLALVLVCSALAYASIPASEARNHVGENATVCGQVASAHYAASSRGRPTFINLGARTGQSSGGPNKRIAENVSASREQ
jgi:hypothetical protein